MVFQSTLSVGERSNHCFFQASSGGSWSAAGRAFLKHLKIMSSSTAFQRLHRFDRTIRREQVIIRIPIKRLHDLQNPMELYDGPQFQARFHILKETAIFIVDLIKMDLSSPVKRGVHIPPLLQFLIAQRYFATNSFQLVVGDLSGLTQPTICNVVKRVARAICKLRATYIKWPSFEEARTNRVEFQEIGGFPGVVGCIDGTHCGIISPGGDTAELFRNRKQYFSVNVQVVCDHKLNIINLVVRWYGSAHDMRIFENSLISSQLENNEIPGILLGDAGYACLPYVMTPYPSPTTPEQMRYNKPQLKTRNCVERAIGCWKRRFPILNKSRLKLKTTLMVIVATGVISNIARRRYDLFDVDGIDTGPVEVGPINRNVSTLPGRFKRINYRKTM